MLIFSRSTQNSQCLEDASEFYATTEARTHLYDTECITSESVDNDYTTILDDDSVIDEILLAGATYYKSKKSSSSTNFF